ALQELQLQRADSAIDMFLKALDYHRKVGNEEGLATTYGQLGKAYLQEGHLKKAEACLNNSTEHFIKLGNAHGEAGALRLLADLYWRQGDRISSTRCLERVIQIDVTYRLPHYDGDRQRLEEVQRDS
ncbi:MAG: tetratricopeptide repeat protein, partial [Nitrospira sp.]|nr:tetratricopeptide repeat protein [Nitrospira sp.]